jgi:hypothetical protein
MCARRFLLVIFWLIVIFVAGAFAIYQFGQQVLVKAATPQGHFQAAPSQSTPDYSDAANWLARPGLSSDHSQWSPSNVAAEPVTVRASVFYVHPTTYLQRDRWNSPLQADGQTESRTQLFVQSQASAFANDAEIWAPRYRQAAYGAFLLKSDDARKALDLAYADVLASFDSFLAKQPANRPIILAGHSQGALHLSRLLRDRTQQLKGRLVAAYVVGWPLSITADLPAMELNSCTKATDTGCVLSWQSFAEPANPELIINAWEGTRGPTGVKRERKDMLCVNPVTGTLNGVAAPTSNPGTLVPSADLSTATLAPGLVGARCEKGLLLISGAIPALGPFVLPGNNYHVYDYALFWAAVRADAERRLAAW